MNKKEINVQSTTWIESLNMDSMKEISPDGYKCFSVLYVSMDMEIDIEEQW